MRLLLVLCEEAIFSFSKGIVWGEEIDALGMQYDARSMPNIESCEIVSPNILRYLRAHNQQPNVDVVIHFSHPSELIPSAVNVLYFQQFFEYQKHDLDEYKQTYDLILTPGEFLARDKDFVHYWPLAVSPSQLKVECDSLEFKRSGAVFIGNEKMRTKDQYRRVLGPYVKELRIFGSGWKKSKYPCLEKCIMGLCAQDEMSRIYTESLVALSLHRTEYKTKFGLATNRSFHAILNGCMVISDRNAALENLLNKDQGIMFLAEEHFADNAHDLRRRWEERHEDIKRGQQFILDNHRWTHRILQLLELIE